MIETLGYKGLLGSELVRLQIGSSRMTAVASAPFLRLSMAVTRPSVSITPPRGTSGTISTQSDT